MPRWVHLWPIPAYLAGLVVYKHASGPLAYLASALIFAVVGALWPLAAWWGTRR